MKNLTILKVKEEGFQRIEVFNADFAGKRLVQITGGNGEGKTSVLNGIWFGLKGLKAGKFGVKDTGKGNKPKFKDLRVVPTQNKDLVNRNHQELTVELTLQDDTQRIFTVRRTMNKSGNPPTLTIEPAIHKDMKKTPQEFLDDVLGVLTFDPLGFTQLELDEQIEMLKQIAKVDVDFEAIAEQNAADRQRRQEINAHISMLDAQLRSMEVLEGLPKEKIDTASILSKLNQAQELNIKAQETFAAKQQLGIEAANLVAAEQRKLSQIETQRQVIERIEAELKTAKAALATQQGEAKELEKQKIAAEKKFKAAPAGEPVDVSALTAELQSADRTNRAIEQRAEYDRVKKIKEAKDREAEALSDAIRDRDRKKEQAVSNAKLPVEGLTFDEQEIRIKGIPFGNLGEGEQIKYATLIGMAANPVLRVLFVRHGEALDEKGIKTMYEIADANKFQVVMARVETSGKVGIVMEEGRIKARND
jgi:hypothetical protein